MWLLCLVVQYLVLTSFIHHAQQVVLTTQVTRQQVERVEDRYNQLKASIGLPALLFFAYNQANLILVICTIIDHHNLNALGPCLTMLVVTLSIVLTLDKVHELTGEVARRAESAMYKEPSLRGYLRFQRAVDRLAGSGPVTACGYFAVTKGTLTTMLATSLTYIIIMLQS